MKVNPSAGYEQYKTYVQKLKREEGNAGKATAAQHGAEANTDKLALSGSGAARAEFGRAAAMMSAEVEAMATPERLDALKAAVDSGAYAVNSGALADAILGYEE